MDQTKRILIHTANTLVPMSLIIVGVGSKDMTGMTILDADDKSLSLRGVRAKRDIVQFVGEFWFHEFFSLFCFFPLQIWKRPKRQLLKPQNILLGFFIMISHILKIILSIDFVEKKVILLTFALLSLGIQCILEWVQLDFWKVI